MQLKEPPFVPDTFNSSPLIFRFRKLRYSEFDVRYSIFTLALIYTDSRCILDTFVFHLSLWAQRK